MSGQELIKTALYDWHVAHGGRMVDFAGWSMPVQYTSIIPEHHAVRRGCGLFDISHMGRLRFTGPDACRFLDHIVTNSVAGLDEGQIRYALVTNEQGGILDDVLVYRFPDSYLLVVNASNRAKILEWIEQQRSGFDFEMDDLTLETCMIAVQGPQALELLAPLVADPLAEMGYYSGMPSRVGSESALVSRTGYTGEDGFELIMSHSGGRILWESLLERGVTETVLPAGLGCRDTLRLEAAMPLYGHELNETIDPYTAGIGFGVKLDAGEFIGRDALIAAKANKNRRKRIGLVLEGKRIAREGTEVFAGDEKAGEVTSGTFSPTLERSIAMAYVTPEHASVGEKLDVDIRGQRINADVVKLPFYRRS